MIDPIFVPNGEVHSESSSESERQCGSRPRSSSCGVLRVVVMLFLLHARVRADGRSPLQGPCSSPTLPCTICARSSTLNCSVNWLKTRNSPAAAGFANGDLNAAHGIADIQEAARLAALAVDRERMADGGLNAEAIERRAEDLVVVEAVDEASSSSVWSVSTP